MTKETYERIIVRNSLWSRVAFGFCLPSCFSS